jgi:dihydrodipicolinate synthase/N-acetylneuraminate lyase
MRLRELLNPIEAFRARQNDALNITTVKAGLELMGQPVGPVRPPNRPLTTAETAELKQVITTIQNG